MGILCRRRGLIMLILTRRRRVPSPVVRGFGPWKRSASAGEYYFHRPLNRALPKLKQGPIRHASPFVKIVSFLPLTRSWYSPAEKGLSLPEFPDDATAEAWFADTRWPNGPLCPHCQSERVQSGTSHPTMPYRCRAAVSSSASAPAPLWPTPS